MLAAIVITTNMIKLFLTWAESSNLKKTALTRKTENGNTMTIISLLYLCATSAEMLF